MADTCRTCRRRILWAKSVTTGSAIPLDPEPVDPDSRGALLLIQGWAYSVDEAARRWSEKDGVSTRAARAQVCWDHPAHLSHFATCPQADQHRRTRR